jgi:type III secretion protein V
LGPQITHQWLDPTGAMPCYLLDAGIEDMIREAIRQTSNGNYLALDPDASAQIVKAAAVHLEKDHGAMRPIVLAPMEIRRYLKKVLEAAFPLVPVLAYQEVSVDIEVDTLGRFELPADALWRGDSTAKDDWEKRDWDDVESEEALATTYGGELRDTA